MSPALVHNALCIITKLCSVLRRGVPRGTSYHQAAHIKLSDLHITALNPIPVQIIDSSNRHNQRKLLPSFLLYTCIVFNAIYLLSHRPTLSSSTPLTRSTSSIRLLCELIHHLHPHSQCISTGYPSIVAIRAKH
jgi:hypothetical protein